MQLRGLIWKVLKEQVDIQVTNLKNKYVGEGKPLTEEDFDKILDVSLGKNYLMSWLTKKVGTNIIKSEDIYKYKEYFEIFEKNKSKFEKKDIHLYKTPQDVQEFIGKVIEIREVDAKFEDVPLSNQYVSINDIKKLESTGGVKYLGMWEKYQVFQIWDPSEKTWKTYRDVLGRCKGRERGAKIEICTIADYRYFKRYSKQRGLSNYFVLYNLDDPKSPYQVHYSSGQFMNKDDMEKYPFEPGMFFQWIEKKVPEYELKKTKSFEMLLLPYRDKGFYDENKKKQGQFVEYEDGRRSSIKTFVDNKLSGPFVEFTHGGRIFAKGFYKNGLLDGEYYNFGDTIDEISSHGFYNKGLKIGVWKEDDRYLKPSVEYSLIDYSNMEISGMTEDILVFSSRLNRSTMTPTGETTFFYKDGSVRAVGKLTPTGKPTGFWNFYFKNGKIKSAGILRANRKREGKWIDYLDTKIGRYIIQSFFENSQIPIKIDVFDVKGRAVDKQTQKVVSKDFIGNIMKLDSRNLFRLTD